MGSRKKVLVRSSWSHSGREHNLDSCRSNQSGGRVISFAGGIDRTCVWIPTPVLLTGKSPGWKSLVSCSPLGHEESDTTEWLHFHFSLSCTGNGNPLQCSCLENPRDDGAWWAAIYGVTQSRTRLRRLSSSVRIGWRLKERTMLDYLFYIIIFF